MEQTVVVNEFINKPVAFHAAGVCASALAQTSTLCGLHRLTIGRNNIHRNANEKLKMFICSPLSLKANETFAFVGNVTHYTRVWLNISSQLRSFLEEGQLHNHLVWLQQVNALKIPLL